MSFYDFMGHKAETQNIIDKHAGDFDCNTAAAFLKKAGGVKAYIRSLGGVFTKYVDFTGKITTVQQLNEVGDYVTGLYDIWGVDYSNGCSYEDWHENRYKSKCGSSGAFYVKEDPKARFKVNYSTFDFANGSWLPTVEEMLEKGYAVCNCGQGVVQTLKKAGLVPADFPDPAYRPQFFKDRGYGYKIIRNTKDLRPGDVLLLADSAIPNRSTRQTVGNWEPWLFHTTIVAEKTADYIITYDTGHAYTYYGETRNKRLLSQKPYEWCADWIAIRLDVTAALSEIPEGWIQKSGKWYFFKDGKALSGWHWLQWSGGNSWFYFEADGVMVTGWKKITWSQGTDWFFFASTGAMVVGWHKIKYHGKLEQFYFEASGAMVTGLRNVYRDGTDDYYLFDSDGVMQTGKVVLDVEFNSSGQLIERDI